MEKKTMTGVVVGFDARKAWGFIQIDPGQDHGGEQVFVHLNQVKGRRVLNEGDCVQFQFGEFKGRTQAAAVVVVDEGEVKDAVVQTR